MRTGHTAHGLPELSMTRLGALVGRLPVFVAADAPVRDAARGDDRRARDAPRSSRPATASAIVTDRDLRERVLAEGRSADDPVASRSARR